MNSQFSDYSNALWGITASDSEQGYVVWGGPPAMGPIDGTVVPAAAGGSLPFLPAATMRVLRTIHDHYPKAWCRYGFVDAFNPLTGWYDTDVIGIDTGITMLMAENCAYGVCLGHVHEEPGGAARHGEGRIQAVPAGPIACRMTRRIAAASHAACAREVSKPVPVPTDATKTTSRTCRCIAIRRIENSDTASDGLSE